MKTSKQDKQPSRIKTNFCVWQFQETAGPNLRLVNSLDKKSSCKFVLLKQIPPFPFRFYPFLRRYMTLRSFTLQPLLSTLNKNFYLQSCRMCADPRTKWQRMHSEDGNFVFIIGISVFFKIPKQEKYVFIEFWCHLCRCPEPGDFQGCYTHN